MGHSRQMGGLAELGIDVCQNPSTVARESNRKPHIDRCFQSKVENIGAGMSTFELGLSMAELSIDICKTPIRVSR